MELITQYNIIYLYARCHEDIDTPLSTDSLTNLDQTYRNTCSLCDFKMNTFNVTAILNLIH